MAKVEKISKGYVVIYAIVLFFILMNVNIGYYMGEQDDYTLPTASFLNDGNFVISEADWDYAKQLFPHWADNYQKSHDDSGLLWTAKDFNSERTMVYDENGEQLTWYFPVYSAFCVPFVWVLKTIGISCEYSVRLANYSILIVLLFACLAFKKFKPTTRLFMVLALSLNPIVLILKWGSAETFMFVLLAFSILFWLNKNYNWAALFCAIVGMVNITILFWGIVMIAEYMIRIYKENHEDESFFMVYLKKWKMIALYATCYVPALIPMAYFNRYVGTITAQGGEVFVGGTVIQFFQRFLSYLFDLNLGMLPYFAVILVLFILFEIQSLIIYRDCRFSCLFIGCIGIMLCYSLHVHINCGMAGIARYNVWNVVFMCIGVPYFLEDRIFAGTMQQVMRGSLCIGFILSSVVVFLTWKIPDSNYTKFTPVAEFALDNIPSLYNPYNVTFYNRENHVDDDFGDIPYPIIHCDEDGYVRKILVTPDTIEVVRETIIGSRDDLAWLDSKLKKVSKERYISVGKAHLLGKCEPYKLGDKISLSGDDWNADDYISEGISANEVSSTWTLGNRIVFNKIRIIDAVPYQKYLMKIKCASTYYGNQEVIIRQGDAIIFDEIISGENEIISLVSADEAGVINLTVDLPNAVSPKLIGESEDERVLALALTEITFSGDLGEI